MIFLWCRFRFWWNSRTRRVQKRYASIKKLSSRSLTVWGPNAFAGGITFRLFLLIWIMCQTKWTEFSLCLRSLKLQGIRTKFYKVQIRIKLLTVTSSGWLIQEVLKKLRKRKKLAFTLCLTSQSQTNRLSRCSTTRPIWLIVATTEQFIN